MHAANVAPAPGHQLPPWARRRCYPARCWRLPAGADPPPVRWSHPEPWSFRCPAARLTEAVDRLVADRLLLAADEDRLMAAAREWWDVYQDL